MVHDDSHSTLRASADNISRRAGSTGMTGLRPLVSEFNGIGATRSNIRSRGPIVIPGREAERSEPGIHWAAIIAVGWIPRCAIAHLRFALRAPRNDERRGLRQMAHPG